MKKTKLSKNHITFLATENETKMKPQKFLSQSICEKRDILYLGINFTLDHNCHNLIPINSQESYLSKTILRLMLKSLKLHFSSHLILNGRQDTFITLKP